MNRNELGHFLPMVDRDWRAWLFDRVSPEPNSGCWLWIHRVNDAGYGIIGIWTGRHSKPHRAHRIAYTAFKGEIPPDAEVCHKCDVPSCLNPDHLFLGTHAQNMYDMGSKGRARSPARRHAVPTPEMIRQIRADGRSCSQIAADLDLGENAVWRIKSGTSWKWIK